MTSKTKKVKKKQKKEKNHIVFMFFVVIMLLIVLVSSVFTDLMQIYENKSEIKSLDDKYQELLEEEESLNSEVLKLQNSEYQARYAREKYLYTKDGEKILTIIEDSE